MRESSTKLAGLSGKTALVTLPPSRLHPLSRMFVPPHTQLRLRAEPPPLWVREGTVPLRLWMLVLLPPRMQTASSSEDASSANVDANFARANVSSANVDVSSDNVAGHSCVHAEAFEQRLLQSIESTISATLASSIA
eukprot:8657286-Karenia_brevis.AAC.1